MGLNNQLKVSWLPPYKRGLNEIGVRETSKAEIFLFFSDEKNY